MVRTAISAVSEDGALANLRAEAPHAYFDSYRNDARRAWARELGRIRIDALDETQHRVFMTALYHTMIAPNLYQDVDGRYRGGDDEVHAADFEHSTVFSLWDTYRALHPLFTILDPARVTGWVRSMLAFQRESGLLPVWTLHANETNCMIGYHAVPVVADAVLKGIGGMEAEEALAAMKRSAEQTKGGLRYYHLQEERELADVERENRARDAAYELRWEGVGSVVNGYAATVDGTDIDYHSSIPGVHHALITRASEQPMPVSWESAPVPATGNGDAVVFAWPAGMASNKGGHRFTLSLDGTTLCTFNTPGSDGARQVSASADGVELRFAASTVDEFGDLFGTMLLRVPSRLVKPGVSARFTLEGERSGSSDWVMTFTHAFGDRIVAANGYGISSHEGTPLQFALLQYEFIGPPRTPTVAGDAGPYIPADVENESVSKTLEYAFDDWCIARVAERLGKEADAARYDERAGYYRTLFDADLGFMRGRNLDGSWRTPFNPRYGTLKQHEYTEGNAWQYSWYVPQDVPGLISLHGGEAAFAAKLDSLFNQSSDLEGTGATGDVSGLIGLYAHGNEPSHHIAYLYTHAGQPWKTQQLVRRIMRELYSDQRDGLSGNEDCGQMSAWYIMSVLGFYPTNPCGGEYDIGSPSLRRAEIALGEGRSFVIEAENNSAENVYVQSATLNGVTLDAPRLRHEDIMRGGTLRLRMGPEPSALWTGK